MYSEKLLNRNALELDTGSREDHSTRDWPFRSLYILAACRACA